MWPSGVSLELVAPQYRSLLKDVNVVSAVWLTSRVDLPEDPTVLHLLASYQSVYSTARAQSFADCVFRVASLLAHISPHFASRSASRASMLPCGVRYIKSFAKLAFIVLVHFCGALANQAPLRTRIRHTSPHISKRRLLSRSQDSLSLNWLELAIAVFTRN